MAALFISFALDLERPSWALLTAYIVAQPFAGMVQSKALYRVAGTMAGGAFAVLALGHAVDCAGSAGRWSWHCGWGLRFLRPHQPDSRQLCLHAGRAMYRVGDHLLPSVEARRQHFRDRGGALRGNHAGDFVRAHRQPAVLFPQHSGAALQQRLQAWQADAARWCADALRGQNDANRTPIATGC